MWSEGLVGQGRLLSQGHIPLRREHLEAIARKERNRRKALKCVVWWTVAVWEARETEGNQPVELGH